MCCTKSCSLYASRDFATIVSTFIDLTYVYNNVSNVPCRKVSPQLDLLKLSNIAYCSCQLLTLSNRKRFPPCATTSDPADAETSGNYAFTRTHVPTTFASLITAEDNL